MMIVVIMIIVTEKVTKIIKPCSPKTSRVRDVTVLCIGGLILIFVTV